MAIYNRDEDSEDEERHNKFTSERTNEQNKEAKLQNENVPHNLLKENQRSRFGTVLNPMSDRLNSQLNSQTSTNGSAVNPSLRNNTRIPLVSKLGPIPTTPVASRLGNPVNNSTTNRKTILLTEPAPVINRRFGVPETKKPPIASRLGVRTKQTASVHSPAEPVDLEILNGAQKAKVNQSFLLYIIFLSLIFCSHFRKIYSSLKF